MSGAQPAAPGTGADARWRLDGRVALVTGASSGLGRELVRQLVLDRGMTVLATARRLDRLESLASELPPGRVHVYAGEQLRKLGLAMSRSKLERMNIRLVLAAETLPLLFAQPATEPPPWAQRPSSRPISCSEWPGSTRVPC